MRRRDGYLALEDLGLIGDGTTSALVGLDGTVVWLCVPRFDSEPVFCGLLDQARGGHFTVAPDDVVEARQRYEPDTAVLVTLTARQLNRGAKIVAAVREEENAPLLRQSGADAVITSASAAGRLLGLSVLSPSAGTVMEDLIQQGSGLDIVERPVIKGEVGKTPREIGDLVVSVVRGHRVLGYDDRNVGTLELTDRLITIVRATPGTQIAPDVRPFRG